MKRSFKKLNKMLRPLLSLAKSDRVHFALRRTCRVAVGCAALIIACALAINSLVCAVTRSRIYTALPSDGESYDCILVLGAGLRPDGSPSHMLEDRVVAAVRAYSPERAGVMIMSGDKKIGVDYDEPGAMADLAVSLGVPESEIVRDAFGYSTALSLLNVRDEYGAERVLIVTQKYHLARAIYIADRLGLEAEGLACDTRLYSGRLFRSLREVAARVKDFSVMIFE